MKYPLFLSDFDGTLVRGDGTISKKNIDAIANYRAKGGIFTVVTGRMLCSILPRLKELGLCEGLVAAYQGGTIADIGTGEILSNEGLSPADAVKAVRLLEEMGLHIHVYMDDVLYCNRDDEYLKMYERVCGVKGVVVKEPLSAFTQRKQRTVNKILAMVPPEEKAAIIEKVQNALGREYFVTASAEYLAEVLPRGVDKSKALTVLSEKFSLPRERIAAIGDELNDLPMIEAAGGKFAVANAKEKLKEIATVVPSVEEDGVAAALGIAMGE